jgi:F0F1-type ATP synthase assembly protein I
MPRLSNDKQELYAKHRANGFIPKKAALAAGYASGSSIYTALEAEPMIVARTHELIEQRDNEREQRRAHATAEGIAAGAVAGVLAGVDQGWVLQQLRENAQDAAQRGDYKESTAALKLIGDHLGMFKTSAGDDNRRGNDADQAMSMDQIDKLTAATEHLLERGAPKEEVDVDLALSLIHGSRPEIAKDRLLTTGSETDVALKDDFDVVDAEFEEIEDAQ